MFPELYLFIRYIGIAFPQLAPTVARMVIGLIILANELGFKLTLEFFIFSSRGMVMLETGQAERQNDKRREKTVGQQEAKTPCSVK